MFGKVRSAGGSTPLELPRTKRLSLLNETNPAVEEDRDGPFFVAVLVVWSSCVKLDKATVKWIGAFFFGTTAVAAVVVAAVVVAVVVVAVVAAVAADDHPSMYSGRGNNTVFCFFSSGFFFFLVFFFPPRPFFFIDIFNTFLEPKESPNTFKCLACFATCLSFSFSCCNHDCFSSSDMASNFILACCSSCSFNNFCSFLF